MYANYDVGVYCAPVMHGKTQNVHEDGNSLSGGGGGGGLCCTNLVKNSRLTWSLLLELIMAEATSCQYELCCDLSVWGWIQSTIYLFLMGQSNVERTSVLPDMCCSY